MEQPQNQPITNLDKMGKLLSNKKTWLVLAIAVFLLVVIIAGFVIYSYTQQFEQPPAVSTTVITPTNKESCEARGGEWKIWRDIPNATPECNLPTSNAEKPCVDSSECESYCEAPEGSEIGAEVTGRCYGYKNATCMQEVKNGVADAEWCY